MQRNHRNPFTTSLFTLMLIMSVLIAELPPGRLFANTAARPALDPGYQAPPTCETAPVDLVILADTTGSMTSAIGAVRAEASNIVANIAAWGRGFRAAVVGYNDPGVQTFIGFSSDQAAISGAINQLYASGGGDSAEQVFAGIQTALNLPWRANASKAIVLFGDARDKSTDPSGIISAARSAGVQIFTVLITPFDPSDTPQQFQQLASGTGGLASSSTGSGVVSAIQASVENAANCPNDEGNDPTPPPPDDPTGPGGDSPCGRGDPVSLVDGSWFLELPCFVLGGAGREIRVSLRYSSRAWSDGVGVLGVGRGWSISYARRIIYNATTRSAVLYLENGSSLPFGQRSDGSFVVPARSFLGLVRNANNTFTLTMRSGTVEQYDANGYLTRIQDRLGNALSLSYAVAGSIATITIRNERSGQTVLLEHEAATDRDTGQSIWQLRRIKDAPPLGTTAVRQATLSYGTSGNEQGRLVSFTDAAGRVFNFRYDTQGRVTTYYDPNNNPAVLGAAAKAAVVTYSTDPARRYKVTQQTLPSGTTLSFNWNTGSPDFNLAVTATGPSGQQRVFRYRHNTGLAKGSFDRIYMPNSTTAFTAYTYDNRGLPLSITDPLGRKVEYIYNSNGDVIEQRNYTNSFSYNTTQYEYNAFSQMTLMREPDGGLTRWVYDATTGAPRQIIREATIDGVLATQTTNIQTNAAGQITAVQLPDGTWNTQSYDGWGYPAVATYDANFGSNTGRLALTETTVYNWRGHLSSSINLQGIRTSYTFNPIGWMTAKVEDDVTGGRLVRIQLSYDGMGNSTQIIEDQGTGRLNATWRFTYLPVGSDNEYKVSQITDPLNQIERYTYTPFGELSQVIEQSLGNRTTTYEYTTEGWLARVRLTDNRIAESYTYNAAGQMTSRSDARGVTTAYTYDGRGRIDQVQSGTAAVEGGAWPAINAVYLYSYDTNDRVRQIIGPNSWSMQYTYDQFNRLTAVRDALGNQTTYRYDNRRNWLTTLISGDNVDTDEITTQYSYDPLGRLTQQIVDPAGRRLTTNYAYSATGSSDRWNLQRVQDPRGNWTTYRYNSLGLLDRVTDANTPTAGVWNYTYNNLRYITGMTPPAGAATTYVMDLLGQVRELQRDGQIERWTYRADGSINTYTDFANRTTTYLYDTVGWLRGLDYPTGVADPIYTYKPNGLLASVQDGLGTTTYEYDALNRLTQRSRDSRTVAYTYQTNGFLNTINYWGQGNVQYNRDSGGRVSWIDTWGGGWTSYSYASTNLLRQQSRANAVATNYTFDRAGRLTELFHNRSGTAVNRIQYTLDNNGNRTQQTDRDGVTTYSYDSLNRLTSVSYPALVNGPDAQTINYGYDPVGNRTTQSVTGIFSLTTNENDGTASTDTSTASGNTGLDPATTLPGLPTRPETTLPVTPIVPDSTSSSTSSSETGASNDVQPTEEASSETGASNDVQPTEEASSEPSASNDVQPTEEASSEPGASNDVQPTEEPKSKDDPNSGTPSLTAVTYYVSTTGNDGNACTTTGAACRTIGGAQNKAADGDTIIVLGGTYTTAQLGPTTIFKRLTIRSDTGDYRTTSTILDFTGLVGAPLSLVANNITIQGFRFRNLTDPTYAVLVIDLIGGVTAPSNITIRSNSFETLQTPAVLYLPNNPTSNLTITDNRITDIQGTDQAAMRLFGGINGGTISNNIIQRTSHSGILIDGTTTNLTISGNLITDTPRQGMQIANALGQYSNITVSNNRIERANTAGEINRGAIRLYGSSGSVRVFNNVILDSYNGVAVRSGAADQILAQYNCFANLRSGSYALYNGGTGTLNGTQNWAGGSTPFSAGTVTNTPFLASLIVSPPNVITSGTNTSVSVVIRDSTGAVVPNVTFSYRISPTPGSNPATGLATTDATGRARITLNTVPAGFYRITFNPSGSAAPVDRAGCPTIGTTLHSGGTTFTYNARDQISNNGVQHESNGSGNITLDFEGTTYTYDAINRLIRTVKDGVTTDYFYDGLNNLIRITVNGERIDFVLDELPELPRVLGEINQNGSQVLYAYGPEGLSARRQINGTTITMSYPLLDGLGSVRHWTDGSGNETQSIVYDAWGNPRRVLGGPAPGRGGPGFTGEQTGSDGTVYLRARYYAPSLGRFLQRDTFAGYAERPQSLNRYAYTENNPVNWTDPSGQAVPAALAALLTFCKAQPATCITIVTTVGGAIAWVVSQWGSSHPTTIIIPPGCNYDKDAKGILCPQTPSPSPSPSPSPGTPSPSPGTPSPSPSTPSTPQPGPGPNAPSWCWNEYGVTRCFKPHPEGGYVNGPNNIRYPVPQGGAVETDGSGNAVGIVGPDGKLRVLDPTYYQRLRREQEKFKPRALNCDGQLYSMAN